MTKLTAALEGLEQAWLRNGMPHTNWLAAGLEATEVEAALAPVGLTPPAEILEWFGWHNGTIWSPTEGDVVPGLGMGRFAPLSLIQALEERSMMMEVAASLEDDPMAIPEDLPLWEVAWLPVGHDAGGSVLTAELGAEDTVPVRDVSWDDGEFKTVRAESLAAVVELWIEWLDAYCEWDPALRFWSFDFAALPRDVKLSGLV
jgi:hypothetical protein